MKEGEDIKVVGLSSGKSKGKTNWKVLGAVIGIIVLAVGVIAGIVLVKQNQNIEEKASCVAACPGSNGDLVNCYNTADSNGEVSGCLWAGRVQVCGQTVSDARQYCCPSAGAAWTTNLTLCATAATASPTATATSTATSTSTSRATATATATAAASGQPNSCGGTCGSNSNCGSGLYCYQGFCRNPSCSSDTDCTCGTSTSTAKATSTSTTKSTTKATTTAKSTASAAPIPVTGVEWPTMLGVGFGVIMILVSLGLAL